MDMQSILIVEDEVDIANLISFNLERAGYSVDMAHDGNEGLQRILKEQPDLVILDLMLPSMDGYQSRSLSAPKNFSFACKPS